ncbi:MULTISPECIES: DinB family protein [unclassified Peribacillus]|uniref:DinB family protein n=1 Tax=unclassified Peribacillus TaxID=2675266 RepID=UPI001912EB42|nr:MULTISPECIES: DinB family protein [unclassified Peribacillus]MBK5443308.1 DinB family protein [Peribacillus sp. TH24]MBK5461957.1 DinB family protein [Peribacillus sp. TH27]MBK5484716.1 DinB family protein [Peribacillus sp. TH16]MBK5500111.1 DinB family protein [Peribacillus sp. TH14]WMX54840.1 DinB family protein [Peribacillus sp. R9-11]
MERRALLVSRFPEYEEEIGGWLWCLEDVRRTLLTELTGISQGILDTKMDERQTIGSLLYHIALVEADWLYEEVLVTEWDSEIRSLFPLECRSEEGSLTHIEGQTVEEHVNRLNKVREVFLSHFRSMDLTDWRKPRVLEQYDVTPEWVVYHLIEHESHHRGQIFQLLSKLRND